MISEVRFDSEAELELDAAVAWYDLESGRLEPGDEFLAAVLESVTRISESPARFPLADDVPKSLQVRIVPVDHFPYQLVFVALTDHVRVLAVAHQRRRPGYWRRRV